MGICGLMWLDTTTGKACYIKFSHQCFCVLSQNDVEEVGGDVMWNSLFLYGLMWLDTTTGKAVTSNFHSMFLCFFAGGIYFIWPNNNYFSGWIPPSDLYSYVEYKDKFTKQSSMKGYSEALRQIEEDPTITVSSAASTPQRPKKKKPTSVKSKKVGSEWRGKSPSSLSFCLRGHMKWNHGLFLRVETLLNNLIFR